MKLFSLEITAALRVTLLLGLVFAAPHLAMAGDEKEGGQQGAAQGNAQPGDTSQSPGSLPTYRNVVWYPLRPPEQSPRPWYLR